MNKIKLTHGKYAIVDTADFEWLNQWKWHLSSFGYALRRIAVDGKRENIWMHRLINKTPEGFQTDHKNRNRLDNRRENLHTVTRQQNMINMSGHKNSKVGLRNIDYLNRRWLAKRWRVRIQRFKKVVHQSFHSTLQEAVLARDNYYGGKSRT